MSESLYATRDLYLYRLADSDLKAEYRWYMSLYMTDDATAAARGMAEMALIKLGERVDKPQAKRIQLVERAAEEAKIAQREHAAEKVRSEAELAERMRQRRMNEAVHARCAPRWREAHARGVSGAGRPSPPPKPDAWAPRAYRPPL